MLDLLDKGYVVSGTADLIRQQQAKIEALEEKTLALKELGIIAAVTSGKQIEGGIVAEPQLLIKFIQEAYDK